ncbi:hypothetical protein GW17_00031990 [Ensete ventricosum]|nr:hypothetical protein GW17_00031990 [Ensete ventricosum]
MWRPIEWYLGAKELLDFALLLVEMDGELFRENGREKRGRKSGKESFLGGEAKARGDDGRRMALKLCEADHRRGRKRRL